MIVSNKLKAAYISTEFGINPKVVISDNGYVVFDFPSEERFYILRNEADNMSREELLEKCDPCALSYLKEAIWVNKSKKNEARRSEDNEK